MRSCTAVPLAMAAICLLITGCQRASQSIPDKAPRPVTVQTLYKQVPTRSHAVSGTVKSWKTEQIGFEVAGRVQWVLEPGKDIERRIVGPEGMLFSEGTALAKIDPARYEVALESARAQLEVAMLNREGIQIRLDESLPAEMNSAVADQELAQTEFARMQQLFRQNAASESELDQAANRVQTRNARIASLKADEKRTLAELKAAQAQIKSAQQAVNDAERDLRNTTLYASYRGQISDVHVVPGSVVSPGSPVLTLQMMDPIKIEVEVSAERSRNLRNRGQLPVSFKLPDGSMNHTNAFVYNIDTSADLTTRTFSLALLLLNEKFQKPFPDIANGIEIARAADIWPLRVNRIVGVPADIFVAEEKAIFQDNQGHYVYQVINAKFGETYPELLRVKRQSVTLQELRVPFLGIWTLREIKFLDDNKDIDDATLIVGQISVDGISVTDWSGDTVMLDAGSQWILRPGDLVDVNLMDEAIDPAYYVPINAIYEESGATSVFVVQGDVVHKLRVDVIMPKSLSAGSLVEIESPDVKDGMQIVVGGVHFLNDGDPVRTVGMTSADITTKE